MGCIAKNRPIVRLQLPLQLSQEVVTGEDAGLGIQVLARMLDPAVLVDDVVGELESNTFVGVSAPVEGDCHGGGLEIDEVQRVPPCGHFRREP